ncbi:GDSL esterase/lipase At4g10955 isoform X2 [Actinidia eriantha]|nr:GDSL esterase/lipase At4g10955 isoform X2 [Actinidia eriantha]XP_057477796.1 GDSL esterase/lipase At4g10955 isoform X2 [Actinidia eriantha]
MRKVPEIQKRDHYEGVMSSEKENFDLSGPLHLTCVDWTNVDHRRSVAACLVQGVYILERDRQDNRQGSQALAPSWWEFFQFRLHTQLVDDADHSIFGAIYEFIPASNCNHLKNGSPHFVIAFRGTLTKGDAFVRDFQLDVHVIRNGLHQTSRFEIAMQAVRNTVAEFGNLNNIWLAGHSLGAAMAMLAGKTMAKTGVLLEAFLFNPPFFSAPIERIKDKKVKLGIRIAGSFLAAGLAVALKARHQQRNLIEDPFVALSEWVPCLFVHPGDHICSEYLGYFEHRRKMEEIGAGGIERLATQNSIGGLIMTAMGKESEDPLHLLPSANLVVNLDPAQDFKQAHGIHQWWRPDLNLQSKVYNYR